MENKIRVNSGIVIEVNDNGDTITVNGEDQRVIEKFMELIENMDKLTEELSDLKTENAREQIKMLIEKTKGIMSGIDDLFGEDTCKKVFGDIVPQPHLIADFFEQLMPIVKQYMDDRQKKIAEKYNRGRKGGRRRYRTKEEIIQDSMR